LHIPFQLEHLRVEHQVNFFMGCDCHIQSRQSLTKDPLTAIRVQTEELANRKNQLNGNAFPRQVSHVSQVSAIRFIRLPTQDGQVGFSSLVFTANRTSLEQKGIFSIFSRL
jgi:hypothetical protein